MSTITTITTAMPSVVRGREPAGGDSVETAKNRVVYISVLALLVSSALVAGVAETGAPLVSSGLAVGVAETGAPLVSSGLVADVAETGAPLVSSGLAVGVADTEEEVVSAAVPLLVHLPIQVNI